MKKLFLVLCVVLSIAFTACLSSRLNAKDISSISHTIGDTTVPTASDSEVNHTIWGENEIFSRFYSTNGEQADYLFERIIAVLESGDNGAMKSLFSPYAIEASGNVDEDICLLIDFFDGEMVEYKRYGPGSHGSKEGGEYVKEIFASYDVTTTTANYRIVIQFCTVHSECPDHIGLTSLYIIKSEDSDLNSAYWGADPRSPGVVIQSSISKE